MNRKSTKEEKAALPSSVWGNQIWKLSKLIILLVMLLVLLSSIIKDIRVTNVCCNDGYNTVSGWVSAEDTQFYWVIDSQGKSIKVNKNKCLIKN